jgi:hypothetical protein
MQELPEPDKVISSDQLVLFVRRWCPSNLELQPFQEVLLDGSTVEELKTKVGCSISVKVCDSQWYLLYPRAHCLRFCVFSE